MPPKIILFFVYFGLAPVLILSIKDARAQSTYISVQDREYQHLVERLEIKEPMRFPLFHSSVRPYLRNKVASLTDSLTSDSASTFSRQDQFNIEYIKNDNSEWTSSNSNTSKKPFLKYFYKNKSDFFHVNTKDFDLHLNPVLSLSGGKQNSNNQFLYTNTRGIEFRGMINRRVGFYSFIAENQALFPDFVRSFQNFNKVPGVPGEGYTKWFKTNGVDFITARGYLTFSIIKNIQLQFGHDRNFIGNGHRSLLLSDFSSNYTFLKLNTHVWKINYQNLFAELNADVFYLNELLPKKYMALHHLSIQIHHNIQLGIFESIIFGRRDTTKKHVQFDFNYLNPIIFFRSIEQQLGSEDNSLLGLDLKVNMLKSLSFYGQVVLDEFVLNQVKSGSGWSGNKQSAQVGIKYFDVARISTLDLQAEMNVVRPYTYSHKDKYRNYTHFNMPLAHPYGANFYEWIGIARYQPWKRLRATAKCILVKYGADTSFLPKAGDNLGGNIFKSYETAKSPFNNRIGQGIPTMISFLSLNFSYQIKHNLFIDLTAIKRNVESGLETRAQKGTYLFLGIRWNTPQRLNEF